MKPRSRRLMLALIALCMLSSAAYWLFSSMSSYMVYFYAPSDIMASPPPEQDYIRIGGLVVDESVKSDAGGVVFTVTDNSQKLIVRYSGVLPSLFREGQGVIAEGYYRDGVMQADTLLAKHDEYYMPPEVAKTLQDAGHREAE